MTYLVLWAIAISLFGSTIRSREEIIQRTGALDSLDHHHVAIW